MQEGEEKNYRIFELYDTVDLSLDPKKLGSQIERLKELQCLYAVSSPTRKIIRKNVLALKSIFSALERVEPEILTKDLKKIEESLKVEFENFKLLTGVTEVKREKKQKKKILNSLEDLALLNNSKEKLEDLEITGSVGSYNLLEYYHKEMENNLKESPEYFCCKMSLIINATTPEFIKLPRLGITISRSSFGNLWNNQYVMAVKKNSQLTKKELEQIMKEFSGEPISLAYDRPMRNHLFPEYNFFWFLPVRVIVELTSLRVLGYAMPFPNDLIKEVASTEKKKKGKKKK